MKILGKQEEKANDREANSQTHEVGQSSKYKPVNVKETLQKTLHQLLDVSTLKMKGRYKLWGDNLQNCQLS